MSGSSSGQARAGRRVVVNVGALGAANLFRIGLSFALQLLVAYFLGVAALGLYAATLAFLHLFQVFSEWGLPALLPRDLAQQPRHRLAGYRAALIIQITLSLLICAGVSCATFWLSQDMARLLWIGSLTLPFYAVMSASETLCEACERMTLVMVIEVSTNALLFIASALVLQQGGQLTHLMATAVAVQAVAALTSIALVKAARLLTVGQQKPDWGIGWLMRRAMPFFGLSLTDVLQQRIDLLLLGLLAAPAVTGVYAAANSLSRVIIKLAQSYWRALYPTLSRLYGEQRQRFFALQEIALRLGWAAALFAAAIVAGLAVEIILRLFGVEFAHAAPVLRILIWAAPLYLLESYLIAILFVERRPRQSLLVGLTHLGAVVIALPILFLWAGATGAAWSALLAGVAGVMVGAWNLRTLLAPKLAVLASLLAAALVAAWVIGSLHQRVWLALAAGIFLYVMLVWAVGGVSRADVTLLRRAFSAR